MIKNLFVVTGLLAASLQSATILVSNLTEPSPPGQETRIDFDRWATQSFITDGNSYTLIDIQTVAGNATGGPSVTAELRKDSTSGTLLSLLSVPSLAGPLAVRTLTPATVTPLDANTTYWLILGIAGAGSFGWSYADGNNSVGPGQLSAWGYSFDQGASWPSNEFDFPDPYRIRVNVDVNGVPEPSMLFLTAAVLAIVLAVRPRGGLRGRDGGSAMKL